VIHREGPACWMAKSTSTFLVFGLRMGSSFWLTLAREQAGPLFVDLLKNNLIFLAVSMRGMEVWYEKPAEKCGECRT